MRCRKHCGFVFTLLFDILIHYELVTLSNAQTRIFLHAHSRTTSMASWTLIDQSWITVGTEVQVFDSIVDGVLVNEGCATSLLIALDGGELISLEPGENVVVGEAVAVGGYTFGCVCKCGSGWVFITHANCGGSSCACTSVIGSCIDPTNSQLIQGGVTGCKPGWGR